MHYDSVFYKVIENTNNFYELQLQGPRPTLMRIYSYFLKLKIANKTLTRGENMSPSFYKMSSASGGLNP